MEYVFLYAGQGSQKEGMGIDFYQEFEPYRNLIDSLEVTVKGKGIKQLMEEATLKELSDTAITQPMMAAFGAGVTKILREKGIYPAAEKLEAYLETIPFQNPKIPVAYNCLGGFSKEDSEIKKLLKKTDSKQCLF